MKNVFFFYEEGLACYGRESVGARSNGVGLRQTQLSFLTQILTPASPYLRFFALELQSFAFSSLFLHWKNNHQVCTNDAHTNIYPVR